MIFQRLNPMHLLVLALAAPVVILGAICLLPVVVLWAAMQRKEKA